MRRPRWFLLILFAGLVLYHFSLNLELTSQAPSSTWSRARTVGVANRTGSVGLAFLANGRSLVAWSQERGFSYALVTATGEIEKEGAVLPEVTEPTSFQIASLASAAGAKEPQTGANPGSTASGIKAAPVAFFWLGGNRGETLSHAFFDPVSGQVGSVSALADSVKTFRVLSVTASQATPAPKNQVTTASQAVTAPQVSTQGQAEMVATTDRPAPTNRGITPGQVGTKVTPGQVGTQLSQAPTPSQATWALFPPDFRPAALVAAYGKDGLTLWGLSAGRAPLLLLSETIPEAVSFDATYLEGQLIFSLAQKAEKGWLVLAQAVDLSGRRLGPWKTIGKVDYRPGDLLRPIRVAAAGSAVYVFYNLDHQDKGEWTTASYYLAFSREILLSTAPGSSGEAKEARGGEGSGAESPAGSGGAEPRPITFSAPVNGMTVLEISNPTPASGRVDPVRVAYVALTRTRFKKDINLLTIDFSDERRDGSALAASTAGAALAPTLVRQGNDYRLAWIDTAGFGQYKVRLAGSDATFRQRADRATASDWLEAATDTAFNLLLSLVPASISLVWLLPSLFFLFGVNLVALTWSEHNRGKVLAMAVGLLLAAKILALPGVLNRPYLVAVLPTWLAWPPSRLLVPLGLTLWAWYFSQKDLQQRGSGSGITAFLWFVFWDTLYFATLYGPFLRH